MIPKFRARDQRGNWHIGLLTFMFGQYAIVNEADENSVYLIDKETVGQSTGLKGYMSDSYKDNEEKNVFKGDIIDIFWEEWPMGYYQENHMVGVVDKDETVKLVTIEISDDLIDELEDERKELKQAILMHDPDRLDENPREDGYDFDYYAAWSDDIAKRKEVLE